ncbi:MAG: hypothetical protein WBX25_07050 [Rhodomicrobium sp.]
MQSMPEVLPAQIASIIREDLAAEAAAGFRLLRRFPNSETASVPEYFSRLNDVERDTLLDALAHYSTIQWSHEVAREKKAHPVLGRFLSRRPLYPNSDWYGERPKKSLIKKLAIENLARAGFEHLKGLPPGRSDVLYFTHIKNALAGKLLVDLNPGNIRQMDYGFQDWMDIDLVKCFGPLGPRDFIPIVSRLAYDHLWDGHGVSNPICWDLITASNVEECMSLLPSILDRLMSLADRINGLAAQR